MQKVILISLTDFSLNRGVVDTDEVLEEFTGDGWKVINVAATSAGYGAAGEGRSFSSICGWFLVTLEKA